MRRRRRRPSTLGLVWTWEWTTSAWIFQMMDLRTRIYLSAYRRRSCMVPSTPAIEVVGGGPQDSKSCNDFGRIQPKDRVISRLAGDQIQKKERMKEWKKPIQSSLDQPGLSTYVSRQQGSRNSRPLAMINTAKVSGREDKRYKSLYEEKKPGWVTETSKANQGSNS